ncbi:MAG: hypothetical protein ACD_17C00277G0002 [uncultured bacterium]|nr:MAG: hypothetical protein ACD_17C00277G0002 [uncultured bacterium]OGN61175.1 MAG: hypothetical protein A3D96_05995 [Chlamydiae bacterium RIFCSPHIGHO2_12_FULL_44_59]OGN69011.1 MAG: hypothetical protein A3F79_02090 [Chlamydiae bacterium RIFCSPLOWO2_12_FULL_45_20]
MPTINRSRKSKRALTLIEIVIACALLALSAGVIGIKMHQVAAKKRFQADVMRFQEQVSVLQKLALVMQADWKGKLKQERGGWIFVAECMEIGVQEMKKIPLGSSCIMFNQKNIQDMEIIFFSTGLVQPEGEFIFLQKGKGAVDQLSFRVRNSRGSI